jgi:hypothetical protein
MKTLYRTINYPIYNIVGDGGLSAPDLGEGRFIPCVIIQANSGSEVYDFIKYQQSTPPGDTKLLWGTPLSIFSIKNITLSAQVFQPMEFEFAINFDLKKHLILVDGIIQSRALFVQCGVPGDKVSDIKKDKLLIEVPEMNFDEKWNDILMKILKAKYKKKKNSNKDAISLAKAQIKSMRELWNVRRPL